MGNPGWSFRHNLELIWSTCGYPLMAPFFLIVFVPFYANLKLYTAYEYLERRFRRPRACRYESIVSPAPERTHFARDLRPSAGNQPGNGCFGLEVSSLHGIIHNSLYHAGGH